MVTQSSRKIIYIVLLVTLTVSIVQNVQAFTPSNVSALQYSIDMEYAKVWINKDGTIDLFYNITVTCNQESIGILTVGMPNPFRITYVRDLSGDLQNEDVSKGSFYGIDVYLRQRIGPAYPRRSVTFFLLATVEKMIWEDTTNKGNVGLLFIPAWWDNPTAPISNLRVAIVLPEGVKGDDLKTTKVYYDNLYVEGNSYVVYWERQNIPSGGKFECGVSFPKAYVNKYFPEGPDIWFYLAIVLFVVAFAVILIYVYRRFRKAVYEKPKISIEALGSARGLTAVEAAVVVGLKPVRVLTMILFGLLRKRFIIVKETDPIIEIEETDAAQRDEATPPRYYEIDFLRAVEPNGSLDERGLARTYLSLRDNVDRKMRGYSRVDTVNYYKSIVGNAWNQITQAGTPQLKGDAIEQNMEWLLLDEEYDEKFRRTFPPDIVIIPRPDWYWYWRGPYFPRGPLPPTPTGPPTTPTEVKPIPAQEWANNVVRGLEKTTNNLVKNVEDLTNRIVAPQATQSSRPVRQGSNCVCACAHCACACACVGCACACAGGGAR